MDESIFGLKRKKKIKNINKFKGNVIRRGEEFHYDKTTALLLKLLSRQPDFEEFFPKDTPKDYKINSLKQLKKILTAFIGFGVA